jgi:protein tyrosine/serine phosphatase
VAVQRLLALAVLAGLLAAAGGGALRHQLRPKRLVAVEPGFLYRSGQISPRLVRGVLEELGIGKVVWMLHYDSRRASHRAEQRAIDALGIEVAHFPMRGDGTGKIERYADAIAEVAEARRAGVPVLVHCAAGSRRSAAVVAMYRLLVEGESVEAAYRELDRFGSRRVAESPLLPYLNDHMGELAALLVERAVIASAPRPLPLLRPPPRTSLSRRLARLAGVGPAGALANL